MQDLEVDSVKATFLWFQRKKSKAQTNLTQLWTNRPSEKGDPQDDNAECDQRHRELHGSVAWILHLLRLQNAAVCIVCLGQQEGDGHLQ